MHVNELLPTSHPLSEAREEYVDRATVDTSISTTSGRTAIPRAHVLTREARLGDVRVCAVSDAAFTPRESVQRTWRNSAISESPSAIDNEALTDTIPQCTPDGVYARYRGARMLSPCQCLGRAMGILGDGQDAEELDGECLTRVWMVVDCSLRQDSSIGTVFVRELDIPGDDADVV
ncbi:uncharacterized protein TRAVEDRAFT_54052 [Trametes versicolor FP-101664 SS1]|uniref:Uncharacterized protein n=1 Tax=Trametes versicolor (strain FP-101664) TaxID=717944 RepID=R7S7R1_TRAVS|nr:uncharacterized protein TRAVEDRAFT_54052 [Trametes versicolor FP-101664 SS1]EIW52073.1 hypothetical protein TRAVEDRAFT_54052 [Trametes versicolor FP-101664 SS1]